MNPGNPRPLNFTAKVYARPLFEAWESQALAAGWRPPRRRLIDILRRRR